MKEIEPTSGKIVVGGPRPDAPSSARRCRTCAATIGCVFQDFKLLPDRSAAENVAYALKVQGEGSSSIRRKVAGGASTSSGLAPQDVLRFPTSFLGR